MRPRQPLYVITLPMYQHYGTRVLSPRLHALRPTGRISACGLFTLDDLATDLVEPWEHLPPCGKCGHYWQAWGGRLHPSSPDPVDVVLDRAG